MFERRKPGDFLEELKAHLEIEADRLREEGLGNAEAYRRACLNLGNLLQQNERFYEASRWAWLEQFRQDLRYSVRQLRRAPAFTLTAVLTLALGIGATTAIFTLIHAVLLKSLPVTQPEQLYTVGDAKNNGVRTGMTVDWDIFSFDLYRHLRDHTQGFEQLAAFQSDARRIGVRRSGSPDAAEAYIAEYVSGNYFSTLGVTPLDGRAIGDGDDRQGVPLVAMISYHAWQRKFGLDPSVIGATFQINGASVTVVGAAPPAFFGDTLRSTPPDFWLPLAAEPAINHAGWIKNPQLNWLYLMGRVQPGAKTRGIEAQMQVELRQWLTGHVGLMGPEAAAQIPQQTLHLRRAGSGIGTMRATYSAGLELLMAISGFVLLIVCANLANLMLVRGMARQRQTSISMALGAGRWRVTRQALVESMLLGLIGGGAGVVIAFAATSKLLRAVFPGAAYVPIDPTPDMVVLAFALGASVLTGLLFGAAPAWNANRVDPIEAVRGTGRATESAGGLQRGLVILQAALSLALLAAAGLLTGSLRNLENQKLGFASEGRVAARIDPNLAGYKLDQLEPLYRRIRERLGKIPGVIGVSYSLYSPMSGSLWTTDVSIDGKAPPVKDGENLTMWNRVGPDYFETAGTRILRGRPIRESDTPDSRHVAVINQAFARRFFPNEDPMGKHFGQVGYEKSIEIVGIAEDAKYRDLQQPVAPMYFVARGQIIQFSDAGTMAFESKSQYVNDVVLRTTAHAEGIEREVRRAFAEIDPNLSVIRVQTFGAGMETLTSQDTLLARLASLFGLTALLLASIGLYGVTSYSVARRAKEIGIRMALGANRHAVLNMVLRNACALVGIGLALGVPLALTMGRLVGGRLYGIGWFDPAVLAGAVLALAACAFAAVLAPARRAASLDPLITLRGD